MTDVREVTCRPGARRALWFSVGFGAVGADAAGAWTAYRARTRWRSLGGSLALGTAALFGWAWRATRVRAPQPAEVTAVLPELDGEVFLPARFLEHTDWRLRRTTWRSCRASRRRKGVS